MILCCMDMGVGGCVEGMCGGREDCVCQVGVWMNGIGAHGGRMDSEHVGL